MRRWWIFLVFIATSLPLNAGICDGTVDQAQRQALLQGLEWRLVAETEVYLRDAGNKSVPPTRLYYMLEAARISVEIFPTLGHGDFVQKMLQRFCYGAQESDFRKNYVNWNIPGYTFNVSKKAPFTFDLGYVGINAFYNVPSVVDEAKELQRVGKIPANIKLKYLDPKWHAAMEKQYKYYLKRHVHPSRMHFSIPYKEESPDDYTSMMIYRVLIELKRGEMAEQEPGHWANHKYHQKLYARLERIYNDYQQHAWMP
jgi:hypothetical protein